MSSFYTCFAVKTSFRGLLLVSYNLFYNSFKVKPKAGFSVRETNCFTGKIRATTAAVRGVLLTFTYLHLFITYIYFALPIQQLYQSLQI